MTREDVIRKCQGLLAMSKSGNEAEMMVAAKKLLLLMGKYQIDMSEVDVTIDPLKSVKDTDVDGKYNESWRRTCYMAAAKLFMCNYYFVPLGLRTVGVVHHIVGAEHNVAVAIEMGKYFESTINRLANAASNESSIERDAHTSRHRFIRAFRLSASNRLYSRVNEFVREAKEGLLIDDETGSRLPAMMSIYDEADALYAAYCEMKGFKMREHVRRDQIKSRDGAALGRAAGEKISFTTQVGNSSSSYALPSR